MRDGATGTLPLPASTDGSQNSLITRYHQRGNAVSDAHLAALAIEHGA
jgi:hypothetical protein